jgi:chemotaxis signal transduction protein
MWRIIEASAKMNCPNEAQAILPTMAATRSSFARLETELVTSLVHEKVRNVLTELGTRAQYVIDIVVRNLFERTADVGFLATDSELCRFVAGEHDNRPMIHHRLCEYRSKYTVYDEILLLDTAGNVLVQIDPATPLEHSSDALIEQTLTTDGYVETFRASDLRPGKQKALIYSRRMHHPQTGLVVGLLCLCFNFEAEMQGIFESHGDPDKRSNMLLLDGNHRVIASADPLWVPLGSKVPVNLDAAPQLRMFAGREYLVRTIRSVGYQGYPGPQGWLGQVMISVDVAFSGQQRDLMAGLDPQLMAGLLSHSASFCPPLHDIMLAARHIQRIVWNGQVMTAGQSGDMLKLKTVLDQISETGNRSNDLFDQSIHDLYQTVLGSSLLDAEFTAHLLVDLLDRNLYERSDDCRWWALAPELRESLAKPDANSSQRIGDVLQYINQLYTVYTRLFVYDAQGAIVASTGSDGAALRGQRIDAATLAQVMALQSSQHYHVPPFGPSEFYGGQSTFIYHAAIRHPSDEKQVVGGIGIVFDSGPELLNMLLSGLGGRSDMAAVFLNRDGQVLSSTSDAHPIGSHLALPQDMLALPNGAQRARVTVHLDNYAIEAMSVSSGYREFKTQDGYRDDVIAVVYRHFGAVNSQAQRLNGSGDFIHSAVSREGCVEYATFYCDGNLMALPAQCVQEAVSFQEVRPTSMGRGRGQIGVLGLRSSLDAKSPFVWVFDLRALIRNTPSKVNANSQVMVLRRGRHTLGLLVDDLHSVSQFNPDEIIASPLALLGETMLVTEVIKANQGQLLIQSLDVQRLFDWLVEGIDPALDTVLNSEELVASELREPLLQAA